jgi:hypothetical protein
MNDNLNPIGGEPLPEATAVSPERWREFCVQLLAQRDQLREELAETERERREYLKLLLGFLPKEEIQVTDQEVLACLGQKPTLQELIAEVERTAGSSEHG